MKPNLRKRFGESFLADLGNDGFGDAVLAEMS